MDNSFDRHSSETQAKTKPMDSLIRICSLIMSRLSAWFVLTEEEKIRAGVFIGRMGKDE